MPNTVQHECVFKALNDDEHLVYGEVYAPLRPDSDGDVMDAETIKKMAHDFLRKQKLDQIDVQHDNNLNPGASVVESFIARKGDDTFIEGSWVVGVHIPDDETWNKVKKGEINGFSIEALVTKTPQTLEVDLPPVINGVTTKSEDHEHQFFITFDDKGSFMGGRTNIEKGHFHTIRAGTITDTAQDHNHRFSFVEGYSNPTQMAAILKAAAECEVYPHGIKPESEITEESPEVVLKGGVGSGRRNKNAAPGPWVVHDLETGQMHSEHPSYGKAMNLADKMNNVHFETATPDKNGMVHGKYGAMVKSSWDAKNAPIQAQKEEVASVEKAAISATGTNSNGVTTGATQVTPPPESVQPPNKETTIQSPDTKPLKKKKNIIKQAIKEAVAEALKSLGLDTEAEAVAKDAADGDPMPSEASKSPLVIVINAAGLQPSDAKGNFDGSAMGTEIQAVHNGLKENGFLPLSTPADTDGDARNSSVYYHPTVGVVSVSNDSGLKGDKPSKFQIKNLTN